MMNISDEVLNIVAKTLYDRNVDLDDSDDWYWDGYDSEWKEQQKKRVKGYIENLKIDFLEKWINSGIHSNELIAKTIILAYDAKNYGYKQKQLINEITDPAMRQAVIKSLKNSND